MPKMIDLNGRTFGRWRVLSYAGPLGGIGRHWWNCRCECGTERQKQTSPLLRGKSKSCGCLAAELASERMRGHGKTDTPLWRRWSAMVQRTTQPSAGNYHLYGGRGISTCERWLTYENFEADMGSTFSPELTLDRIDVDGDYSPENCRWATLEEQANNKRISKQIEWLGQSHTGPEWGRLLGIKRERINHRLRVNGWSINRALSEGADADKLISMATPSQLNELAAALEAERAGAMPKLCIRGHEFTTRNGRRLCRTCERDSQRRYDQRKRAKRDGVLASIEITS